MNKIGYLIILFVTIAFPHVTLARINVFACEPEWGALTKELGSHDVNVYTATTAFQDPHRIEARPSLIAKMRRANLLVCSGADLEIGWLPLLLRSSANREVQIGQPGYFEAAMSVDRLEVTTNVDRAMGDIHTKGNPHVHLDPRRMITIAKALALRLSEVDPANAVQYQERLENFLFRWRGAIDKWEKQAAPLKGKQFVVYHRDWVYLFDWLGIKEAAALESKPGVPPSTSHLGKLLTQLKANPPNLIIYTSYQHDKAANWLSKRTDIPAIQLPFTVGGNQFATDLFGLMDEIIKLLLEGLQQR